MKTKNILWIALGLMVCGIAFAALPVRAVTTQTQTIIADKDAYVSSLSPTSNYGTPTYYCAGEATSTNYTAYFHFPYTATPANFVSAEIILTYYHVESVYFYAEAFYVTDDSWSEYSLNWNNQPYTYGGWTVLSSDDYISESYTNYKIDVTGRTSDYTGISIAVNSTHSTDGYMQGYSRESSSLQPSLVYTYLVSSFIPGYDVTLLVATSLGIVAILGYKVRNKRSA